MKHLKIQGTFENPGKNQKFRELLKIQGMFGNSGNIQTFREHWR
jgi:hypothetical protein